MKKILTLILIAFIGGMCLQKSFSAEENAYEKGALYIKFNKGTHIFTTDKKSGMSRKISVNTLFPPTKHSKLSSFGLKEKASSLHLYGKLENTYRIEFDTTDRTEDLMSYLESLPSVEYVERVPEHKIFSLPNDPFYNMKGKADGSWHMKQIGFDSVYGKYYGNPDIKVAVVDNAIWADHPDLDIALENRYFAYVDAEGECAPPPQLNPDENCTSVSNCPSYSWSHGTHCAGLIAAVNNNDEGIVSFASGITLLAARASDLNGKGVSKGYECILWAIDKGARILSLSWGGPRFSQTEKKIIETAVENGIIFLVAAGNENSNALKYPASYEGVICVGSVDSDNKRSSFSNYGNWVDIAAPGGFKKMMGIPTNTLVLSTTFCASQHYRIDGVSNLTGEYYDGNAGTSMATPLAASVVALMLSVNPNLKPFEVEKILKETAKPISDFEMSKGGGVINAHKAVERVAQKLRISENKNIALGIYPNPAQKYIEIRYPYAIKNLSVYDISGNLLKKVSTKNTIDISDLPAGFLIITAQTENGIVVGKCIKQ